MHMEMEIGRVIIYANMKSTLYADFDVTAANTEKTFETPRHKRNH